MIKKAQAQITARTQKGKSRGKAQIACNHVQGYADTCAYDDSLLSIDHAKTKLSTHAKLRKEVFGGDDDPKTNPANPVNAVDSVQAMYFKRKMVNGSVQISAKFKFADKHCANVEGDPSKLNITEDVFANFESRCR